MTIRRTFNADPQVLGTAARRTGQLARIERDIDREREDVKFFAQLGETKRARKVQESLQARQQRTREKTTAVELSQRGRDQNLRERKFEEAQFQFDEAPGRHLQESINERELLLESNKWQFSEQQKRDQQKVNDTIGWVQEQNWTPQEKEQAIQSLMKKHRNILPQFGPDLSPSAQKRFDSSLVKGPEGKLYQIDDKGKATWINETENKITADLKKAKEATEQKVEQAKLKAEADFQSRRVDFITDMLKLKKRIQNADGSEGPEVQVFTFEQADDMWNKFSGKGEVSVQASKVAAEIRSNPQGYLLDRIRAGTSEARIEAAKEIISNPTSTDAQLEELDRFLREG